MRNLKLAEAPDKNPDQRILEIDLEAGVASLDAALKAIRSSADLNSRTSARSPGASGINEALSGEA